MFKAIISLILTVFWFCLVATQSTTDCGTTYGCYRSPLYCKDKDCMYLYKWKVSTNNANIDFEMYIKTQNFTNKWASIGFSKDNKIGDDNLVVCNTKGTIQNYLTTSTNAAELIETSNPTVGLTSPVYAAVGDFIKCTFTRAKQPSTTNVKYYDLNIKHFIVASYGDFDAATPNQLLEPRNTVVGPHLIQFTSTLVDANNYVLTSSDCRKSSFCLLEPTNCVDTNCLFLYKWRSNGSNVEFEIAGKIKSFTNRWLAAGFSKDDKMGDDSVVVCKTTKEVQNYYNTNTGSDIVDGVNTNIGISSTKLIEYDEHFICIFNRLKEISSSNTKYFNLTQKLYLFAAHGEIDISAPNKLKEHIDKKHSDAPIDFTSPLSNSSNNVLNNNKLNLVSLMVIITTFLIRSHLFN